MKTPKLGTILWVRWTDSTAYGSWREPDAKAEMANCASVGFLHEWTKKHIVLSQNISFYKGERDRDDCPYEDLNQVADLIVIPRSCVTEWCEIK